MAPGGWGTDSCLLPRHHPRRVPGNRILEHSRKVPTGKEAELSLGRPCGGSSTSVWLPFPHSSELGSLSCHRPSTERPLGDGAGCHEWGWGLPSAAAQQRVLPKAVLRDRPQGAHLGSSRHPDTPEARSTGPATPTGGRARTSPREERGEGGCRAGLAAPVKYGLDPGTLNTAAFSGATLETQPRSK